MDPSRVEYAPGRARCGSDNAPPAAVQQVGPGGQLLWLLQPALSLLVPGKQVTRLANVLEKPETVSALVSRLERNDA